MEKRLGPQELQSLVSPLLALCHQAGAAICEQYRAPGADQFESKGDDSPLTRADILSHRILRAGLAKFALQLPMLSEESGPEKQVQRRSWERFWLVDPLDGTKEFLARTGEFTVNVALIEDHRPRLGMLYLPLEEAAFVGIPGLWARRFRRRGGQWSEDELATRPLQDGQPLVVLASRRHRGPRLTACLDWLEQRWGPLERSNSGSALKFCQMAVGEGDFYPRFSPCSEWDTAAGQALLEAAGGSLLGLDGAPLRYNCRDSLLSPDFLALAQPQHPLWGDLLAHLQTARPGS
jgi:3'(2'), 5'-bisphosphate nucleotidase